MPSNFHKGYRRGSSYFRGPIKGLAKVNRDLSKLKKLINVEYKTITTSWAADPNTTGVVQLLSAMTQGDDIANRQGRKVKLFSIRSQGSIKLNASATSSHGRMIIVRDNLGSTTRPAITDMFPSVASFLAGQPRQDNPQTNARFSVIMDHRYLLEAEHSLDWVNVYNKIGSHVTYTGTSATDEGKGNIYLFSASSESANDPVVAVSTVLKFIDN